MAVLKPIVVNLTTRGACAVDYIDYFDEGQYGPDKPFFVGRFDDFESVAKQIRACLALQGNSNSLIHNSRHFVEGKWIEPLVSPEEKYPQRAQYMIRFIVRVKFYGEFAYLDIGKKWDGTSPNSIYYVLPKDLEVLNYCMLSKEDANAILDIILNSEVEQNKKLKDITDWETYTVSKETGEASISKLTSGSLFDELTRQKEIDEATYFSDGDFVFGDDTGLISID